ncbi:amidase, partial [Maricaulis sp. CAU 1757]
MARSGTSRRDLLRGGCLVALGGAAGATPTAAQPAQQAPAPTTWTPDIEAAESLFDIRYSDAEREQLVDGIEEWIERTAQLRALEKPNSLAPACVFDPRLPGRTYRGQDNRVSGGNGEAGPLPAGETDIAFAPVWKLSAW